MSVTRPIGQQIDELETPCLVLDLDALERNLDLMASLMANRKTSLRPHAKSHKSPLIARMQLARGASGICCAKLGEAEVMADAGIGDILVTTEVVGKTKIARMLSLSRLATITTVVDDQSAAAELSTAAVGAGARIRVLIDIDIGQGRTGVSPGARALALARTVSGLPGLELVGVQGYEGHLQHIVAFDERRKRASAAFQVLSETVALLVRDGHRMEVVSTAGTGTFETALDFAAITEVQPGSYVFMDSDYSRVEGILFEAAIWVAATVISVREREAIVDAGLKVLSSDSGPAVPVRDGTTYVPAGDEHGKLRFDSGRLVVGDRVRLLPSHCDTTVNLHDAFYVVRGGVLVNVWPVSARGRSY